MNLSELLDELNGYAALYGDKLPVCVAVEEHDWPESREYRHALVDVAYENEKIVLFHEKLKGEG